MIVAEFYGGYIIENLPSSITSAHLPNYVSVRQRGRLRTPVVLDGGLVSMCGDGVGDVVECVFVKGMGGGCTCNSVRPS